MYFIKLVNLYNNYEMMGYYVDYLKSSTSWIIEYVDDTHIQVTYYTENGSKENKKTIEIQSLTGALTEEDEPIVETEPKAQPEIQPEIQPEVVPKPQPEAVPELVPEADTPVVSDEIVIEADMHDVSGVSDEIELETNFW